MDTRQEIAQLEQQIAMLRGGQATPQQMRAPQGLLSPPGGPGAPAPGFQADPQLQEIFGLMAQYGDDPMAAGQGYVNAAQRQQQLGQDFALRQQQQDALRYGAINPHDFTPESIQAQYEAQQQTGNPSFGLLERYDPFSTKEQGFLNDAITRARTAEADMARMTVIADGFDEAARSGIFAGRVAGGLNEWAKGLLGTEDAVTQLRTEYEQVKNKAVVQGLPPGVASDRDIEIAMRGWPSSTSNPAYIASFLRGMQKLRALDMAQAMHEAQYIDRNNGQKGGMLQSWEQEKDYWLGQALAPLGGIYNPPGATSADEAAEMRYAGGPAVGGATPGQINQGVQGAERTREDILKQYGVN